MSTRARDPFSCFVLQCGRTAAPVPVPAACSSPCPSLVSPPRVPWPPVVPWGHSCTCMILSSSACCPPPSPFVAPAPFQAALSLSLRVPLTAAGRRPVILFIAMVQSCAAGWEARSWAVSRSEDRLPAGGEPEQPRGSWLAARGTLCRLLPVRWFGLGSCT